MGCAEQGTILFSLRHPLDGSRAVAGFNAVAEADGHREWRVDADAPRVSLTERHRDLARMIGVADDVSEPSEELALPQHVTKVELTTGQFPSYVATRDKPGETIMIIGDSFTVYYFAPLLLNHVGRVVWQHHKWCGFDWKLIDRFQPREVWWMPTERYLLCAPNVRPDGFPTMQRIVAH